MSLSAGTLYVDVKPDASGINSQTSGIGASMKTLGIAAAAAFAGAFAYKAADYIKGAVAQASDLNETVSKVGVVFGKGAADVRKFAADADVALGQTKQQALDAAATFGIFGKAAGLSGGDSAKFSIKLTKLASDMASFSNTTPEDAVNALGGALRGESEPIRRYGVMLNEAAVQAEAVRMGLLKNVTSAPAIEAAQVKAIEAQRAYNEAVDKSGKSSLEARKAHAALGLAQEGLDKATEGVTEKLTQQQKILATQSLIFKQTKDAQGDFQRTSDGLANQQRILGASFENIQTKIGKFFLPVVLEVVKIINKQVVPAVKGLIHQFGPTLKKTLDGATSALKGGVGKAIEGIGNLFKSGGGDASAGISSLADSFKKLGPFIKELADSLPGITDIINVTAVVFGFLADHVKTLTKFMPLIIAAFIAYKLAIVAAKAVELLRIPLLLVQLQGNRSLAASNRALAASQLAANTTTAEGVVATEADTVAKSSNILTSIRQKVAIVATTVASVAANAATKAWTAAQWAWNAAMSANPIGLIILAVVALIALVVILWKKNETFRRIVLAAWGAVKKGIIAVWEGIKTAAKVVFAALKVYVTVWLAVFKAVFAVVKKVVLTVWGWIKSYIKTVWGGIKAVFDGAKEVWSKVFDPIKSIATSAFNGIATIWNNTVGALSFHVPSWVPKIGGSGWDVPDIPLMAEGGIVSKPTLAVIGEAGPEAVVPLDKAEGMLGGKSIRIVDSNLGLVMDGVIQSDKDYRQGHARMSR